VEQVVAQPPTLLADADVLIDFAGTEPALLHLVAQHLGALKVASQVLDTVDNLSESACRRLGIEVVQADTEALLEAGSGMGRLSFEDRLNLILCRAHGWICVTNDGALRTACDTARVTTKRGLRLLVELVQAGHLTKAHALRAAEAIAASNPQHIHSGVLARFRASLEVD